ncbi:Calcium-activated potassium channel subunit beta-4 [Acipenser ruthenus]|uniref:Calcium-activated potassium channel subunit beta-4 n=1 Tax=Acipenser ruthenus TaxID=7906 RepID=A0A662YRM5_ACIRT|nr:Calcium-activated potassium channel subunit beta-4 [Acipenser ruthenus]
MMARLRVSYEYSEAEDKTIRLGLFLIVCGIVSLFILCFCWLNPTLQNMQCKPVNCTVLSVQQSGEMFECTFTCGVDCKGTSRYPCLQIYVNNSESYSQALLHFNEQQLLINPKLDTNELPDFYKNMLNAWRMVKVERLEDYLTAGALLEEPLFFNSLFPADGFQSGALCSSFAKGGITKLKDLLQVSIGRWREVESLAKQLGIHSLRVLENLLKKLRDSFSPRVTEMLNQALGGTDEQELACPSFLVSPAVPENLGEGLYSIERLQQLPAHSSGKKELYTLCVKCSYLPPCARDNQKNTDSVLKKQHDWTKNISQSFTCFFDQQRRPDDVLLERSHDESVLLHCVLWPLVSLLVGVLIVVLTVCARSLAVRAEALQKRKFS